MTFELYTIPAHLNVGVGVAVQNRNMTPTHNTLTADIITKLTTTSNTLNIQNYIHIHTDRVGKVRRGLLTSIITS